MHSTTIQGYIPALGEDDEICYSLTKQFISETQTVYSGLVGYATICTGTECPVRTIVCHANSDEVNEVHPENDSIHTFDTKPFSCMFDSVKNKVTITCPYRFELNPTRYLEDYAFELEFENPEEKPNMDENAYPYIRFPRTKDGVSISRICTALFSELPTKPVVYFPCTPNTPS